MRLSVGIIAALILAALPAQAANPELAASVSPYLRQHADDPVHWRAWSPGVLEQARHDGKLVFLSIGYASCHFCHKMAEDTFHDPEAAAALNATFVPILIDREERPDLDLWFGRVLAAIGGQPGWPMTLFVTPDLVPLFGANFMPPHGDAGGPGLLDVAIPLAADWANDPGEIRKNAAALAPRLNALAEDASSPAQGDPRDALSTNLALAMDPLYGGFGLEAKFPQPAALTLLLHQAVRRNDSALLTQVSKTLDQMAAGGIRDQLGGAFHRYATDRLWLMPHFEIDLALNAALAHLYLEAFQATGRQTYAVIAQEVLDDLIRRLRRPDGTFASGLSADCDGIEGGCYLWSAEAIQALLPDPAPFLATYLPPGGGRRVLRVAPTALDAATARFAADRARLLAARAVPARDDKVLTSANALAASAFALAARVLDRPAYRTVAETILRVIDTTPLRHAQGGDDAVFLDDYAFLIQATLDLAEGGGDPAPLDRARVLTKAMTGMFEDAPGHPLRLAAKDPSGVPPQVMLQEDGLPTGNASALIDRERLALFRDETPPDAAALHGAAAEAPGLALAWDWRGDAREIVIIGRANDPGRAALTAAVNRRLLPGTVFAVLDENAPESGPWPILTARPLEDGKATAYVCRRLLCQRPVTTAAELAEVLTH